MAGRSARTGRDGLRVPTPPRPGQPDGQFSNSSGSTYSHTFTAAGTYPYYCNVHCTSGMKGTITVQ